MPYSRVCPASTAFCVSVRQSTVSGITRRPLCRACRTRGTSSVSHFLNIRSTCRIPGTCPLRDHAIGPPPTPDSLEKTASCIPKRTGTRFAALPSSDLSGFVELNGGEWIGLVSAQGPIPDVGKHRATRILIFPQWDLAKCARTFAVHLQRRKRQRPLVAPRAAP